ncbi:cell wall-binding repeat-containing protein [Euzebya sp.]|uniref:cell wall-binding repeat-containing protein n=1 Tax=Euzebya sp. TaxID=1971409 RepID=UPI00351364CF
MSRRHAVPAVLAALLVLSTGLSAAPAGAAVVDPPIPSLTTVPEAPDHASERFGDPWDFGQATDVHTWTGAVMHASRFEVAGGQLIWGAAQPSHYWQIWPGYPGGLRLGREGAVHPVDPTRHSRVSLHLYTPIHIGGAVSFLTCVDLDDPTPGCKTQSTFIADEGWQVLTVPVPTDRPVYGMHIDLPTQTPAEFRLDWVRLHGTTTPIAVTLPRGLPADAELVVADAAGPADVDRPGRWSLGRTTELPAVGAGVQVDPSAWPPGTYRLGLAGAGLLSGMSAPITVSPAPQVQILDPDITGGEDFATAVRGNPWDFSDAADIEEVGNASWELRDGALHAVNAPGGPTGQLDPYVILSHPPLTTDRYHRFTITTRYEGAFDLRDAPGGGAHGRIGWMQADEPVRWQQTAELVHYPGHDTMTVVMGTQDRRAVMEHDLAQPGFGTSLPITRLRYDPNEDRGARRWSIDHIALRADDETRDGRFTVRLRDAAAVPGTTVSLFADVDAAGFDGVPLALDVPVGPDGAVDVPIDTRGLTIRTAWIHVEATTPAGARQRVYATGPLQVIPAGPPPAADVDRVFGAERTETAAELAELTHPDGAGTVVVAAAHAFPDALSAAPLAAALDAPVLLTATAQLSPATAAAIDRLSPSEVVVLGGTAAVSDAVVDVLRGGGRQVERIGGVSRYATAAAVAEALDAVVPGPARPPVVVDAGSYADALAVAPWAADEGRPLLLSDAGGFTEEVADLVADTIAGLLQLGGDPDPVTIAGRLASAPVAGVVGAADLLSAPSPAELALAATARREIRDRVLIASADDFPDALAAGAAAASLDAALVLTGRSAPHPATRTWLAAADLDPLFVGGPAAISDAAAVATIP